MKTKLIILIVFGFILNLGSWYIENFKRTEITEKIEYLKDTQVLISQEELSMNEAWTQLTKELNAEKVDTSIAILYANRYINNSYNIIAWAQARLENDEGKRMKIIADKNNELKKSLSFAKAGDLKSMISAVNQLDQFQSENVDTLLNSFNKVYNATIEKEGKTKGIFRLLYMISIIIIFIGSLFKDFFLTKK